MFRVSVTLALLSVSAVTATPLPVSGGGTFWNAFPGIVGWQGSIHDDQNQVLVACGAGANGGSPATGYISASCILWGPGADINGIHFSPGGPGSVSLGLGGGGGSITGYDAQHNPLVTVDLISYVYVTSYVCSGPQNRDCDGTFKVTGSEVPEPSSLTQLPHYICRK
jgi:hypothetical protein